MAFDAPRIIDRCAWGAVMKIASAMLVPLMLLASPAWADTPYQSAMSGSATVEDVAHKLKRCGEVWNKKLQDYETRLPRLEKFLAYYRKWESYPAQRPPKSPEPILTRADYRACISACLDDNPAACPGGWPAAADETQ
jgi:hypothetical protein